MRNGKGEGRPRFFYDEWYSGIDLLSNVVNGWGEVWYDSFVCYEATIVKL